MNQLAKKIIVAAPVGSNRIKIKLNTLVNEVVILLTPPNFMAVSQGYISFNNLDDETVLKLIQKWEAGNGSYSSPSDVLKPIRCS